MITYRPEIDGLRAIAVLSVVFYHAQFTFLQGGSFGVDIFFVISGFLISLDLFKKLESNTFSLLQFWEKRIRRIFPMLAFVSFLSLPFSLFLIVDSANKLDYLNSFIASILSVSNIYFRLNTDYFSPSVLDQPLIHTWSLAVEEQFYLIFPLIFLFAYKKINGYVLWAFVLIFLVSFSYANYSFFTSSYLSNFYLITSRAWELLAGSILAYCCHHQKIKTDRPILSYLGISFILFSIFFIKSDFYHVSFATLLPVLGTVLVIGYRSKYVYQILSNKIFIWIGLISYSLYLLHQPVFAFLNLYGLLWTHNIILKFAVILILLMGASITYRFIEKPFRYSQFSRKLIFQIFLLFILSFLAVGMLLKNYIENPLQKDIFSIKNECTADMGGTDGIACSKYGYGKKVVVIYGDSHAHYMANEKIQLPANEYKVYYVSKFGCPPLLGVKRYDKMGNSKYCDSFDKNKKVFEQVLLLKPDTIMLVGRWSMYQNGAHSKDILQPEHHLLHNIHGLDNHQSINFALPYTIDFLHKKGINVKILEQVPDLQKWGRSIFEKSKTVPYGDIQQWHQPENDLLIELEKKYPNSVIWTKSTFCSNQLCHVADKSNHYYIDNNHPSNAGVALINPVVKRNLFE